MAFTPTVELRAILSLLTVFVWLYLVGRLRYRGFVALLAGFTVNLIVRLLIVFDQASTSDPLFNWLITGTDVVFLGASIIFTYTILRNQDLINT